MRERPKIPKPTARRLSLYLRKLEARKDAKLVSINSSQLGEALGLTGAQAQKDFATFGTFGRPVLNTPLYRYVNNYRLLLSNQKRPVLRSCRRFLWNGVFTKQCRANAHYICATLNSNFKII
jgi:hypothetical protein